MAQQSFDEILRQELRRYNSQRESDAYNQPARNAAAVRYNAQNGNGYSTAYSPNAGQGAQIAGQNTQAAQVAPNAQSNQTEIPADHPNPSPAPRNTLMDDIDAVIKATDGEVPIPTPRPQQSQEQSQQVADMGDASVMEQAQQSAQQKPAPSNGIMETINKAIASDESPDQAQVSAQAPAQAPVQSQVQAPVVAAKSARPSSNNSGTGNSNSNNGSNNSAQEPNNPNTAGIIIGSLVALGGYKGIKAYIGRSKAGDPDAARVLKQSGLTPEMLSNIDNMPDDVTDVRKDSGVQVKQDASTLAPVVDNEKVKPVTAKQMPDSRPKAKVKVKPKVKM